ncbi:hypothetical protein HDU98_009141 [Podochytrium sp. JEL0797]|nr:hypothetical protein HDU98_009141 [Podochytrium sp. JEL0797]
MQFTILAAAVASLASAQVVPTLDANTVLRVMNATYSSPSVPVCVKSCMRSVGFTDPVTVAGIAALCQNYIPAFDTCKTASCTGNATKVANQVEENWPQFCKVFSTNVAVTDVTIAPLPAAPSALPTDIPIDVISVSIATSVDPVAGAGGAAVQTAVAVKTTAAAAATTKTGAAADFASLALGIATVAATLLF